MSTTSVIPREWEAEATLCATPPSEREIVPGEVVRKGEERGERVRSIARDPMTTRGEDGVGATGVGEDFGWIE